MMESDEESKELEKVMEVIPEMLIPSKCEAEKQENVEENECEFVKRMIQRAYADKRFEDPQIIADLSNGTRECNSNAATLVLKVLVK